MIEVLSITFPLFGAIALGYGAVAAGLFSGGEMRVLGRYVLNIALPALLFDAVAGRDLGEVLHPGYMAAMLIAGLATVAVGYGAVTLTGTGPARRAIAVMGMSVPNSAYVGYPALLLALPDLAGQVLALNFLVENFAMIPLALFLLEIARPSPGRNLPRVLLRILWNVLRRPFVIGLLMGLAVSLLDVPYPAPLERFVSILAASASALALVVIGGTLHGLPMRGNKALAAGIASGKLLLHPAMAALAVAAVPWLGLPALTAEFRHAAVLSAAMPMFGIYVVLAQPYGHDGLASISLLAATGGAFVTLSALLFAL
ncbi:AEC family transporter [Roseovarius salis]|uniref:AEC family transporter n=1 Tax=Roseovarius salis TaxID=3376063 RepID=UPI0037CC933A